MKKLIVSVLCLWSASAVWAQTNVGVSIGIHQPGVYGRIEIGDAPRPRLVQPQPVIIVQQPQYVERRPIYLYVPPAHQSDWGRHCGRYNACGQPVYFVQEQWVRERYEQEHPHWKRGRSDRDDHHPGRGRGHDRDKHPHKDREKDRGQGRGRD